MISPGERISVTTVSRAITGVAVTEPLRKPCYKVADGYDIMMRPGYYLQRGRNICIVFNSAPLPRSFRLGTVMKMNESSEHTPVVSNHIVGSAVNSRLLLNGLFPPVWTASS